MRRIFYIVLLLFIFSCSENREIGELDTTSLNIAINTTQAVGESTTKAGSYKRGNAPAYVKGVKVTANNLEYTGFSKSKDFQFVDYGNTGGDDLVMEGVTVGNNRFSAVGIPAYGPVAYKTCYSWLSDLPRVSEKDLDEMATDYSKHLQAKFPIYAKYTSENSVDKIVTVDGTNDVALNMVTTNHRVAMLVENKSDKYRIRVIYVGAKPRSASMSYIIDPRWIKGYAVVYNDDDAKGTIDYSVTVEYYTKDTGIKVGTIKKEFTVTAGQNVTKYYRFVNTTLVEGDATLNITWTPMTDDAGGEDLG